MNESELVIQSIVLFISLFAMMIGLIFTIIPPIPGMLVIWAAAVGYGLMLGWEKLGWVAFSLLTFLMILGFVADTLAGQFGAKIGGASCLAVAVGTVVGFTLGILGSFFTPVVGCLAGLFGTLGGILLVERHRQGDWNTAINAMKGYLAGNAAGIMVKVTTGCLMIGAFLVRVFVWG
jgi:hypothetical protein